MNPSIHKTAIVLFSVLALTFTGCSAAEVQSLASQAQSQGGAVISNLTDQAKDLGEKSMQVAQNIKQSVAGYMKDLSGSTLPTTAEDFEVTWEEIKLKLDEMSDNAVSPETRARIDALSKNLQDQYLDAKDKISNNQDVQEVKETVSQFWTEVKTRMDELAP